MTDRAAKPWQGSFIALICVPMMLAPPMAMIGPYGITLAEAMILFGGIMLLAIHGNDAVRLPAVLVMYLAAYSLGWLGSLFNGFNYGITFSPGHLSLLYVFGLCVCGYVVGRYSKYGIDEIMTSRVTAWFVVIVAVIAIVYPFLSPGTRALVLRPVINQEFMARLASPRFPGMGLNANVYSFIVYVFFLFTMAGFLAKRGSALVPLGALIIILGAASRTVTALALASAAVLIAASLAPTWIRKARSAIFADTRSRRRAILVMTTIFAVGLPVVVIYGSRISEIFTLYDRVSELLAGNQASGLSNRQELWSLGIERIKLSPILGIPKDLSRPETDTNPLYYYSPHNEFIYFWGTFGLLTMLAHVYLIVSMILANLRRRAGVVWLLLYGAMIVQMTFDALFQGPRVVAFCFMIIGLNMRYLAGLKPRPAPVGEPVQVPA